MSKSAESELTTPAPYQGQRSADGFMFLRAWLKAPFLTATMVPSGPSLSKALAAVVDPRVPGPVVELGPGTGPVTAALVARGINPDRLILIEYLPEFCKLLQSRYPTARVVHGDAFSAASIIGELNAGPLAAVVSCLPLYARPPEVRQKLLMDMLTLGRTGMPFVQATNFPRLPIPIDPTLATAAMGKRIWRNMFPALVCTYRLAERRT
jgi:phosphatidylethanolamine/phosphatidyl-N-methylethanolamine N-methyltransferase